jgi:hypothetical protein
MRYRIYGPSGVTAQEKLKLKEWDICKPTGKMIKARVKRKVRKVKLNEMENKEESLYQDDSRSCDSAYTHKFEPALHTNEEGDPTKVNEGFTVVPLCPTIYGKKAAKESVNQHFRNSMKNSPRFKTLEPNSTFDNGRRQSRTRNQFQRAQIEMPIIRTSIQNTMNNSLENL